MRRLGRLIGAGRGEILDGGDEDKKLSLRVREALAFKKSFPA
jgi:hypothetical protein